MINVGEYTSPMNGMGPWEKMHLSKVFQRSSFMRCTTTAALSQSFAKTPVDDMCRGWSKLPMLRIDSSHLDSGYINCYYWVDDHPLLYGKNRNVDPSMHGNSLLGS